MENVSAAALERRPVEARLAVFRKMRAGMQNLEIRRVPEARDDAVRVPVESKPGAWFEMEFMCEPEPPHFLAALRIEESEGPDDPAFRAFPDHATQAEVLAEIGRHVDERAASGEFSGVILVARSSDGRPVRPETM
jgi:hypothetical protein